MSDNPNYWLSLFTIPTVNGPEPMTNAGRYLRQLDIGESRFHRHEETISDELCAALRRIQIATAKDQL